MKAAMIADGLWKMTGDNPETPHYQKEGIQGPHSTRGVDEKVFNKYQAFSEPTN